MLKLHVVVSGSIVVTLRWFLQPSCSSTWGTVRAVVMVVADAAVAVTPVRVVVLLAGDGAQSIAPTVAAAAAINLFHCRFSSCCC